MSYHRNELVGGSVVAASLVGARTANPAARLGRFVLVMIVGAIGIAAIVGADCRRKNGKIDSFAAAIARRAAAALLLVTGAAVGPVATLVRAIVGRARPAALGLLVRNRALLLLWLIVEVTIVVGIAVAFVIGVHPVFDTIVVITVIVAPRASLLLIRARAVFAQHAEIMIGELKIIFGLDAITSKLRIASHALVFLVQLGGVAALPIVLAIAAIAARHAPGLLSTAAATAAALTIVDQTKFPRRTGALAPGYLLLEGLFVPFPKRSVIRIGRAPACRAHDKSRVTRRISRG